MERKSVKWCILFPKVCHFSVECVIFEWDMFQSSGRFHKIAAVWTTLPLPGYWLCSKDRAESPWWLQLTLLVAFPSWSMEVLHSEILTEWTKWAPDIRVEVVVLFSNSIIDSLWPSESCNHPVATLHMCTLKDFILHMFVGFFLQKNIFNILQKKIFCVVGLLRFQP